MKAQLSKNTLALTVAIFMAIMHGVWALLVFFGVAQKFIDWMIPLHFLKNVFTVMGFNLTSAIMLVVMAFACGYAMGWVFAAIYNGVAHGKE